MSQETQKGERLAEKQFEEIIAENFQNLVKDINLYTLI